MKKTLSMVLLCCMIINICAFATDDEKPKPSISKDEVYILEGDNAVFCPEERGSLVRAVKPGSAIIFPIDNASKAEDIKNLRVFTIKWEMGEEFTLSPYIEYRMLYEEDGLTPKGYRYVAVLPLLSLAGENKANIKGYITLGEHKSGNFKRKFSFVMRDDGTNPYIDSYVCDGIDFPLEFGKKIHQVALIFGDEAQFLVDASGQGPLNVGFTVAPYTDYLYLYPNSRLEFLRFTKKPIFDRSGQLIIFSSSPKYVYEITPVGLVDKEAVFDEEEGGCSFKTRRLGDYIITDKPLGEPVSKVKIFNPPTGVKN